MVNYFDPRAIREQQKWAMLSQFGAGLAALGSRNPGGVQAAIAGMGQATDPSMVMRAGMAQEEMNMRRATLMQRMEEAKRQEKARAQRQAAIQGLAGGDPRIMNALTLDPGTVVKSMFAEEKAPGRLIQTETGEWVPNPAYIQAESMIAEAGRPISSVEVRMPEVQTEFDKAAGKGGYAQYEALQKDALSSENVAAQAERIENLLQGLETGTFAEGKLAAQKTLKSIASTMGIDIDFEGLGALEGARSVANQMALQLRGTGEGGGMPGAMSDRDREFLVSMTPGLAMTPEGRKVLVDTYRKIAQRKKDVARKARQYVRENNRFDYGFYDELQNWANNNEMFASTSVPAPPSMEGSPATSNLSDPLGIR